MDDDFETETHTPYPAPTGRARHRAGGGGGRRRAGGHRRRRGGRTGVVIAAAALTVTAVGGAVAGGVFGGDGAAPAGADARPGTSAPDTASVDSSGRPPGVAADIPVNASPIPSTPGAPGQPGTGATPSASTAAATTAAPTTPAASPTTTTRPAASTTTAAPTTRSATPRKPPAAPGTPTGTAADYARQVVDLVNVQRANNGCAPLTANTKLQTAAQGHSDDMVARNYFAHNSPEGSSAGDRINATGYQWSTWGENIAMGQRTPAEVMDAWMNSPGHRANILNCSFTEIGVGVNLASGSPYWTQNFAAPR
ncbi:CAP domain-containing protein [Yinghuangia seranimata]|uniref:CAP domain-containing protein n=1 Tax=Yinghuangia seranimata TaxID=408067 RepID=UPI00248C55F8|nr:CAP domain-containing protein [Yinghuangia seranimata]MDI2131790.1 CAP domain-containing protein [Yinghuangia seranimata]